MSDAKDKANALVGEYKARLNPYVKAMKQRGYFGEAAKLQAKQQAEVASKDGETKDTNSQANKQPAPQGQQPAKTGMDSGLLDHNQKTGGNGLDGGFLSINAEVKPDATDVTESGSRAPDIASAVRPTPSDSFDLK